MTTLYFDKYSNLRRLFKCIPWRTNTETNHTTLTFSSGYEAQLLVQVVATHVSLVNVASFNCPQKTQPQDNWAKQHLAPQGMDSRACFCGFAKLRCMSEIGHHRLQQRLSLNVPHRLYPITEKKQMHT